MGKHRHSKDRLFITASEHKTEWGGKKDPSQCPIPKLAFNYCPLSLQPFKDPVCTPNGICFDIVNIVPFVKKYGKNPVDGTPLKLDDLIKLTFYKDAEGNYICPVSSKVLTESSKIVAIKTSGVVYSAGTVEELNKKPKFFFDLMTNKKFAPSDIIVIQDPMNWSNRLINDFDYIKKDLDFNLVEDPEEKGLANIQLSSLGKRVLSQVEEKRRALEEEELMKKALIKKKKKPVDLEELLPVTEFLEERKERNDWRHERHQTGKMATSVTSTYVNLETGDEKRGLSDIEILMIIWNEIKSLHLKTHIQLQTNLGEFNAELHSDHAVRTVYSFLDLVYKGSMSGMKFKRLLPGEILYMENSASRELKFDTVDKSEKMLHDKPGLFTIDTLGGLNTMGITMDRAPQLNNTHSMFGEILSGLDLLSLIDMAGEENGYPNKVLEINQIKVLQDPYRETCRKYRKRLFGFDEKAEKERKKKEENEIKIGPTVNKIIQM